MARKSWFGNWQTLVTPEMFVPFLLGAIALGVLSNAVFQLLTNLWGTTSSALTGIALGSVVFLLTAAWLIQRLLARRASLAPLTDKKTPEARHGLILLVSNEATARRAVAHHRPALQWCWLLHSDESFDKAVTLRKDLADDQIACEMVRIQDVYDVVECRRKIVGIYEALPAGCGEADVILDFTGMTAVVSVGAVLACREGARAIQYTPAVYDRQLAPDAPLQPIEVIFS